jgi:TRAP-type transport system periplasmic protein
MKFYEVMSQIALTSHLVGYDLLTISSSAWNNMTPEQQEAFQAAADEAMAWSAAEHRKQEEELADYFRSKGLEVYTPDVDAFRAFAQEKYLNSPISADWPEGMIERINAL